jgi:medium-chain acyl-[acyl-carrier-protein] hydrolase
MRFRASSRNETELNLQVLSKMVTLSVDSKMVAATPWLSYHKPNPWASLRLFCFPYAGSGALIYRTWAGELPRSVEVCPVQLPGRGGRIAEKCYTRLSNLVDDAALALLPYLDKPFAFFGHSMGALVSFELARRLRVRYGLEPVHLFASGRAAPQLPPREPPAYNLPEKEFLEKLRTLNGTPQDVLEHPELIQLISPIIRADFEAIQTYTYTAGTPFKFPLTVFGGLQDDEITRDELEAWRAHALASFRLRMLPGDHFFLHSAQPLLLRTLTQELYQTMQLIA